MLFLTNITPTSLPTPIAWTRLCWLWAFTVTLASVMAERYFHALPPCCRVEYVFLACYLLILIFALHLYFSRELDACLWRWVCELRGSWLYPTPAEIVSLGLRAQEGLHQISLCSCADCRN